MDVVEEGHEEFGGVALDVDAEFVFRDRGDLLEEFVRGDMSFEGAGVPNFAEKQTETFD